METSAGSLEFVIQFVQMDLDTLRPGDWLNLRHDLAAFLGLHQSPVGLEIRPVVPVVGVCFYPGHSWSHASQSEQEIYDLQRDVHRLLSGLVDTRNAWLMSEETGEQVLYVPPLFALPSLHVQLLGLYPDPHKRPCYQGQFRDLVIHALNLLIAQEPLDRILRCPECGTIFYRVRKQKYCSRICVNRVTVRRHRQRAKVRGRNSKQQRRVTHGQTTRES